jgi:squalene-hopene/tetraprenyl-beta-curcumene cyclase
VLAVIDPSIARTAASAVEALLQARTADGHWDGLLSSSALSTATAIAALALYNVTPRDAPSSDRRLIDRGIEWLIAHQNDDGGWGDTDRSPSNISTTALGWSALAFGSHSSAIAGSEQRASAWLRHAAGGDDPSTLAAAIVARYGNDRTFSVPILTMCALAGRLGSGAAPWHLVPHLPFELAVVPRRLFTIISLPVVSYALPALISMGLVRHRRGPSRNPLTRSLRSAATRKALSVLESLQPPNGGFLEAAPLTSFVAMSLAGAGEETHPVTRRAIGFLRRSVRDDGSWPIDTNLATWVTTLSVQALTADTTGAGTLDAGERKRICEWLLAQQTSTEHRYTGAARGAWAWTNLPGGVPDADDTAGALLALRALDADRDAATRAAAVRGVEWLLNLQNRDGGVPTFCRGWGALPFDRSGADLTAHAVRAWLAWHPDVAPALRQRIDRAVGDALRYLASVQRADGAFVPLWFGNHHAPDDANPTYGTSRVLLALDAVRRQTALDAGAQAGRALRWLQAAQNADGGWGGDVGGPSSIEETALATGALAAWCDEAQARAASERGAAWLVRATKDGIHFPASPIGFYFAKLWYYERLYPILFVSEAFERMASASRVM